MSKRLSRSTIRPISSMNLTSMMDCVWLLLITFIITFPMIEQAVPVNLPRSDGKSVDPSTKSATVTVDAEGRIYVNTTLFTDEALENHLKDLHSKNPDVLVLIRGDEKTAYGHIVTVLKIIRDAGVTRMSLVTRET